MNLFWLYFIVKVALRVMRGGEKKDDRSDVDDDEEEGEDEREKAREQARKTLAEEKEKEKAMALEPEGTNANGFAGKENRIPITATSANGEPVNGNIKRRR